MSRIGKQKIEISPSTEVTVVENNVTVKGSLGQLSRTFGSKIVIKKEGNEITLVPANDDSETSGLWGTYAREITNMISGVNKPFERKLIVEGIGYKSEVKGNELVLDLGFSHDVKVQIPQGIKVTAEKNLITISGIDKDLVGQVAAKIRMQKKPEPYKGKGIRYSEEIIKRKQGKKTV